MRAAWLVLLGACYQEAPGMPCTLTCDEAPCPGRLVCGSDHVCHAAGALECSMTGSGSSGGSGIYVKATTPSTGASFGESVALSADGSLLAVGAPGEANGGSVYLFHWDGTAYELAVQLIAVGIEPGDQLGASVAMSSDGTVIAAGAPLEDGSGTGIDPPINNSATDAGVVVVFNVPSGQSYTFDRYKIGTAGVHFGASVALTPDGTAMAIGAPASSGPFPAYAWRLNTTVPTSDNPSVVDGAGMDHFGTSVAIGDNGAIVLAGADGEDSAATGVNGDASSNAATDSGAIDLFAFRTPSSKTYFKASNTGAGDHFGTSVGCSGTGDVVVAGAPDEDSAGSMSDDAAPDAGAVYAFASMAAAGSLPPFEQAAYLKAPAPTAGDHFGQAVKLTDDGSVLAVGAPGASSMRGMAIVFTNAGTGWQSPGESLTAFNGDPGDQFGTSVAVSNDHRVVAVGAPNEASASATDPADNSAAGAGAVYVFR